MPCGKTKAKFKTKSAATRHGAITYGKGHYSVRKVKGGYSAYKK
jgi:hypothetical protein